MRARLLLAAATILIAPAALGQSTWYVDDDACHGPELGIHPQPFSTIQAALDVARHGDEIIVAPGTYREAIVFPPRTIRLRSAQGATVTTIDARRKGAPAVTFMPHARCEPLLEGFTITNGEGRPREDLGGRCGGGVYIELGRPLIRQCIIFENDATYGGGLYNDIGDPVIEDCLLVANLSTDGAGGAIFNRFGEVLAVGCDFSSNRAIGTAVAGGAILTGPFSNLTLADCSLMNNESTCYGGGIAAQVGARLQIVDSMLRGNSAAAWGGAVHLDPAVIATIDGCEFTNNWAGFRGGAVCATGSYVDLSRSRFECNLAGDAGGVDIRRGMGRVISCEFKHNRALSTGGGLRIALNSPLVANCSFYGNAAPRGAALQIYGAMPSIVSCSVASNFAAGKGGAVRAESVSHCAITNSVIWANGGGQLSGDRTGTVTMTYTDVQGDYPGIGNTDQDPMFRDLANGDLRFRAGSPCIDCGDNVSVPTDVLDFDQDGDTQEPLPFDLLGRGRFGGGASSPDTWLGRWPRVDLGAFEHHGRETDPPAS